jgi:hypothetical protein
MAVTSIRVEVVCIADDGSEEGLKVAKPKISAK